MDLGSLDAGQLLELVSFQRLPLALAIAVIGWVAIAVVGRLLDDLGERFADRRLTLKKVKALLRFGAYVALGLIVPLTLLRETDREALVPLFATLGLGLGFAFRDLVASLIAGVTLLIDEPFQVGDRVSFGGYYGEVTEIGLRSVRLVTLDDNLVTIPNSKFLTESVASANAGALDCMVVVGFTLQLDADVATARALLEEVAATSAYVYLDKPVVTVAEEKVVGLHPLLVVSVKSYVFDARHEKAYVTDLTARGRRALREAGLALPEVAEAG
ncbi:MAG: mechanosensitive ion channel [Alphaproteobacteria bacterium]|nr:mechanosensitive ion channel [Alphaproteobacteria bacterium]